MPNTPVYAWPYQSLTDAPDGPTLGSALALAAEATVKSIDDRVTTNTTAIATLVAAVHLPVSATVITTEGTSSTTYTDLATAGPSVTIVTGTRALVTFACGLYNSGGAVASFEVSGATTIAADEYWSIQYQGSTGLRASMTHLFTGLTPGSNTFKMKYRAVSATANYFYREIIVDPR